MMTIVRTSFALQIINCHILNPYQCSSFREIDLFIAVFIFDTVYLYCILVSKASIFYWEDGLRMISGCMFHWLWLLKWMCENSSAAAHSGEQQGVSCCILSAGAAFSNLGACTRSVTHFTFSCLFFLLKSHKGYDGIHKSLKDTDKYYFVLLMRIYRLQQELWWIAAHCHLLEKPKHCTSTGDMMARAEVDTVHSKPLTPGQFVELCQSLRVVGWDQTIYFTETRSLE